MGFNRNIITRADITNLVAWVTRRASANDVTNHLELAARLLLR